MASTTRFVTIEYPDGRRYDVTESDYYRRKVVAGKDGKLQTHQEAGAKIAHWADDRTPYDGEAPGRRERATEDTAATPEPEKETADAGEDRQ